jgi:hypothetical protein
MADVSRTEFAVRWISVGRGAVSRGWRLNRQMS